MMAVGEYSPLIGRDRSRDLNTGLPLVDTLPGHGQ